MRGSGQQVHKVRFVASTLLDAVRKAETAPASAARAHAYLCELRLPPSYIHTPSIFLSFAFVAAASVLCSAGAPLRILSPDFRVPASEYSVRAAWLTRACVFSLLRRGLPVHPVGDRTQLPVSLSVALFSSAREGEADVQRLRRLDDDRDGASNDTGMPLMAN